jgi:hypothetical protein
MLLSRRFIRALLLAVALFAGQQMAALHDLAHAQELLAKSGKPASSGCDLCFACAQLSGGASPSSPVLPIDAAAHVQVAAPLERESLAASLLAFRSRAPPNLL